MAIEVFGAGAVQTAYVSYLALDITPNSLTLLWPTSYVDAPYTDPSTGISYNILAASMDVTTPILNVNTITLPNAMQSSVGQNFIITNVGLADFELLMADGSLLQVITPGISYWVQLTDNSTVHGTWTVIVFGAGVSEANAALLAGKGLTAIGNKLNTNIPVESTNIVPSLDAASRAKIFIWTGGVANIPLPAIGSVPAGFYVSFNNQGAAAITIAPGELGTTIDNHSNISVSVGQSLSIISDGAKWWSLGFGQNQFTVPSSLNLDVSASVDVTLTSVQAANVIQNYTGALTGNITIFFPNNINYWYINNLTTGNFTLSVQLAGPLGTSYVIAQGTKQIFYSNGLSISPIPTALKLADGNAEAPSISFSTSPGTGICSGTFGIDFPIEGVVAATIQHIGTTNTVSAISPGEIGMSIGATDTIGSISYANVDAITINDTGAVTLPVGPLTLTTGKILVPNGGFGGPSYSFSSDPNTGMWLTVGSPSFLINGVNSAVITNPSGTKGSVSALAPNSRGTSIAATNTIGSISYANTDAITFDVTGAVTLPAAPLAITSGGTAATTATQAIINLMPFGLTGDIVYFDGANWVTLPIGGNGDHLEVVAGLPAWVP